MAKFKMATIIKLSENGWVWVRLNYFESESEWSGSVFEWIWEKIRRCQNPRWQYLNQTWQNSRWLPSSSWVKMNEWNFFVQIGWSQNGRIQDGCHYQVEWEWKIEVFFLAKWMTPTWQNLSWLPSSSWVRENEWSFFCGNGGNQSWQVWVSLRGNTKMAESNIAKFKMSGFKMAAFIKLSENEWVWVRLN